MDRIRARRVTANDTGVLTLRHDLLWLVNGREGGAMDGAGLRGLAVVSIEEAEKLGTVEDVVLDIVQHRVSGLVLQGGLFRGAPVVAWSAVRSVGQDAVMVDDRSAVSDPEDQDESELVRLGALRGTKVVTEAGDLAGRLTGAEVDPASGQVSHYVVTASEGGLLRSATRFTLPPAAIAAVGPELMTVDARVIEFQQGS